MIGMSIYTNQKIKTIGNPDEFFNQTVRAITGMESTYRIPPSEGASPNFLPSLLEQLPPPIAQSLVTNSAQRPLTAYSYPNTNFSHANVAHNNKTNEFIQENKSNNISKYPKFSEFPFLLSLSNQTFPKNQSLPGRSRRGLQNLYPPRPAMLSRTRSMAKKIISNGLKSGEPFMGFSFYFLWLGCASHFFAIVVGITNWRRVVSTKHQQPYPV